MGKGLDRLMQLMSIQTSVEAREQRATNTRAAKIEADYAYKLLKDVREDDANFTEAKREMEVRGKFGSDDFGYLNFLKKQPTLALVKEEAAGDAANLMYFRNHPGAAADLGLTGNIERYSAATIRAKIKGQQLDKRASKAAASGYADARENNVINAKAQANYRRDGDVIRERVEKEFPYVLGPDSEFPDNPDWKIEDQDQAVQQFYIEINKEFAGDAATIGKNIGTASNNVLSILQRTGSNTSPDQAANLSKGLQKDLDLLQKEPDRGWMHNITKEARIAAINLSLGHLTTIGAESGIRKEAITADPTRGIEYIREMEKGGGALKAEVVPLKMAKQKEWIEWKDSAATKSGKEIFTHLGMNPSDVPETFEDFMNLDDFGLLKYKKYADNAQLISHYEDQVVEYEQLVGTDTDRMFVESFSALGMEMPTSDYPTDIEGDDLDHLREYSAITRPGLAGIGNLTQRKVDKASANLVAETSSWVMNSVGLDQSTNPYDYSQAATTLEKLAGENPSGKNRDAIRKLRSLGHQRHLLNERDGRTSSMINPGIFSHFTDVENNRNPNLVFNNRDERVLNNHEIRSQVGRKLVEGVLPVVEHKFREGLMVDARAIAGKAQNRDEKKLFEAKSAMSGNHKDVDLSTRTAEIMDQFFSGLASYPALGAPWEADGVARDSTNRVAAYTHLLGIFGVTDEGKASKLANALDKKLGSRLNSDFEVNARNIFAELLDVVPPDTLVGTFTLNMGEKKAEWLSHIGPALRSYGDTYIDTAITEGTKALEAHYLSNPEQQQFRTVDEEDYATVFNANQWDVINLIGNRANVPLSFRNQQKPQARNWDQPEDTRKPRGARHPGRMR